MKITVWNVTTRPWLAANNDINPMENEMKNISLIAKVCHDANRSWCNANDDHSQPAWEDAPDWQIESAINGVYHALTYEDATPAESHSNWMADKIADGWVYGEVKDAVAKTHPCMVPYDDLPEFQRKKDALFLAIVRVLA